MAKALEEAELRAGLKQGGAVLGAFIVERQGGGYAVYLRTDWIRGRKFRVVQTWRSREGDRIFKSVDVAMRFIRRFDFCGRVTIYPEGDRELAQFAGLGSADGARDAPGPDGPAAG